MKVYKVLTQKDKWFSGKFDPELLEKALNAYAQQGWQVVQSVSATIGGIMSSNREELIIILERDAGHQQKLASEAAKHFQSPPSNPKPSQPTNPFAKPSAQEGESDVYKL